MKSEKEIFMINKIVTLVITFLLIVPELSNAVQLPATGQTACFDINGNPRACLGTGEDGEKQAGAAWPVRFSDNGNATITDNLTGLIWSKNANAPDPSPGVCVNAGSKMTWQQALAFVTCLNANNFSGFADWRLPNLNEMESLVHAGAANSSVYLIANGFTLVQADLYWTSTNDNSNLKAVPPAPDAWDVSLVSGDLALTSDKDLTRAVWPVRGLSTQLWKTGQTKCFDVAGSRINPCGTSLAGQDGEMLAGAAWPSPRFKTNVGPSSAATLAVDKLTGLIWPLDANSPGPAACPDTGHVMNWQEALDHIKCLNQNSYLGLSNWRLPNRKEVRSHIDYATGNPALPDLSPFVPLMVKEYVFWSSTTSAADTKTAWVVSVFDGSVNAASKGSGLLMAWPVSGPDISAPALTIDAIATSTSTTKLISGTVEAGVVPEVTVSAPAVAGSVTVSGTAWSVPVSGLSPGANSITVTAADLTGNIATQTAVITVILSDGKLCGGAAVSVCDALKALRIAVGLATATNEDMYHGDVAPLTAPDNRIDISDALLILKKAVGLISF
ncbi:MAG: DUF1566 domain-containing protein [Nitrospirae bacterium]|nr:DUF1566 domain-containing protein [Nitrospirota bacterium]